MKLVYLTALASVLALYGCSSNNKQTETTGKANNTNTENTIPKTAQTNTVRTPKGSHFTMTLGGTKTIFDEVGDDPKANHYLAASKTLRMVRFTADQKKRISIQVYGFDPNTIKLPFEISKDSLGINTKCTYYDKKDKTHPQEVLHFSKSASSKIVITEVKGDSIIGTITGFFSNQDILNRNICKIEDGRFRIKIEDLNSPNL